VRAGAEARLPQIIIGGAPRSGTTFLAALLDQHPDIYIAKPYVPEAKVFMTAAKGGPAGYRARYAALFADAGRERILGEKTSYYLENEDVCPRIRATLSDVHLLFIVREPVARAVSNYLWSRHNGLETLSFAEAVALEGQRASPLPRAQAYARPFDYLTRGRYATFAERYIAAFGNGRVHFLLFEDIALRTEEFCRQAQLAAQVEPLAADRFDMTPVNALDDVLPIDSTLAASLRERLRPEVMRFAALTGLDISPWGY
jgi:hypothetical protein